MRGDMSPADFFSKARFLMILVPICSIAFVSCIEREYDLPDKLIWESEHFRYFARENDTSVCEDTKESFESHFDVISDYLNFEFTSDYKIAYYKYLDIDDLKSNSPCISSLAIACTALMKTGEMKIHSFELQKAHELIHAYLLHSGVTMHFVSEGFAEALSWGIAWPRRTSIPPDFSLEEVIELSPYNMEYYPAAGWWMGYLINRFGIDAVFRIHLLLSSHEIKDVPNDIDKLNGVFLQEFGITASQTWSDMRETATAETVFVGQWTCNAEAIPTDGEHYVIEENCTTPYLHRTFEVDTDSTLIFTNYEEQIFQLTSCSDTLSPTDKIFCPGEDACSVYIPLKAGKYFFEPRFSNTQKCVQEAVTDVNLELVPNFITSTCDENSKFIEVHDKSFSVHFTSESSKHYVNLSLLQSVIINKRIYGKEEQEVVTVKLCADCDTLEKDCINLESYMEVEQGKYVLMVESNLKITDPFFVVFDLY